MRFMEAGASLFPGSAARRVLRKEFTAFPFSSGGEHANLKERGVMNPLKFFPERSIRRIAPKPASAAI